MNLTSIGSQNRLVAQAAEAVGGKGNIEATGHPITGQIEVAAPAPPYPDAVYHEVKLDGTLRPTGDGGVIFRTLSSWEFREQAKLDAHKRAAELRVADMERMKDVLKSSLELSNPELAKKILHFLHRRNGFDQARWIRL